MATRFCDWLGRNVWILAGVLLILSSVGVAAQVVKCNCSVLTPFTINQVTPLVTTGAGVLIKNAFNYIVTVPTGQTLSLIEISHTNLMTTIGGSEFYGLKINTQGDAINTASGVYINNTGRSHGMYVALHGVAGVPTTNRPTGIGIDMNRQAGSSIENSASFAGVGMQIWDFSTSDIAVPEIPSMIALRKYGNLNTNHIALSILGNRRLIELLVDPTSGGYSGTSRVVGVVESISGAVNWSIQADANQVFASQPRGIEWDLPAGINASIKGSANSELDIRSGVNGFRVLNNTFDLVWLGINGAGNIYVPSLAVPAGHRYFVCAVDEGGGLRAQATPCQG